MVQTRTGAALGCRVAVMLFTSVSLLLGLGQGSAQADVTAVQGSAFGYSCVVSVFGQSCTPSGPTPSVTLASNGSNSPQSASALSASANAGPATIFSSGRLDVSTQGTLGPNGSVTTSTNIANVNASGQENFTATSLAGSCTASETAVGGSTTITGGSLMTDNGDDDPTNSIPDHPPVTVPLPTSPAPDTTYLGHVHIGNTTDNFRWKFNEQILNGGTITVNAAHEELLGPTAIGDLIVGHSVCGVTSVADTTAPQTTIDSGPSGTTSSASPSFAFSSSEAGSTFECKLDGPGAATGSFSPCSSPKNYTGLAGGSYTFSVRAKDTASNTDATPATSTFTVSTSQPPDTTAPVTKLTRVTVNQIRRKATFRFSSSEAGSSFRCKLDKQPFRRCSSPKTYRKLKRGRHTFKVVARDAAGNLDRTPVVRRFRIRR